MTFPTVLNAFLAYSEHKASYRTYHCLAVQHFDAWETMPDYTSIESWHQRMKKTPHYANKGLAFLKALFNWAIRHQQTTGFVGPNPASGIKRHPTFSRERVMTMQEVALILKCTDLIQHEKLVAILTVLLLTGCRLSEARMMQRQHVNLITGAWLQPQTKNGKPHTTYLPLQARQALAKLPTRGDFFFMGAYEHCWSRAGVEKTWRQVRGALGLLDVRLHDFRRTLSTHLYRATKDDYLVKRCINHVNTSITAVYVRVTPEEVATALQAQADRFYAWAQPAVETPEGQPRRRVTDAVMTA